MVEPLGNLPLQSTSFVGRAEDLAELRRLASNTRLLTLTGMGGVGKSRLALEVSAILRNSYGDGAWLVDLTPVAESALVAQAAARALEVKQEDGCPLVETLSRYLARKQLLLILDNCEHVVQGSAQLVETLLSSCPGLKVLATSRVSLKVKGEATWLVRPLSVPKADLHLPLYQSQGDIYMNPYADSAGFTLVLV